MVAPGGAGLGLGLGLLDSSPPTRNLTGGSFIGGFSSLGGDSITGEVTLRGGERGFSGTGTGAGLGAGGGGSWGAGVGCCGGGCWTGGGCATGGRCGSAAAGGALGGDGCTTGGGEITGLFCVSSVPNALSFAETGRQTENIKINLNKTLNIEMQSVPYKHGFCPIYTMSRVGGETREQWHFSIHMNTKINKKILCKYDYELSITFLKKNSRTYKV